MVMPSKHSASLRAAKREIKNIAEEKSESPVNTFISTMLNRIREALGLKAQVEFCYVNRSREARFDQMKLDAANNVASNALNLLF